MTEDFDMLLKGKERISASLAGFWNKLRPVSDPESGVYPDSKDCCLHQCIFLSLFSSLCDQIWNLLLNSPKLDIVYETTAYGYEL